METSRRTGRSFTQIDSCSVIPYYTKSGDITSCALHYGYSLVILESVKETNAREGYITMVRPQAIAYEEDLM